MTGESSAFDFIAMPKGQAPGGPVQSSAGNWYLVIPAQVELIEAIQIVEAQRSGRPVTDVEKAAARKALEV